MIKLSELVEAGGEYGEIEIDSLAFDSRETGENSLFFCLTGGEGDGHIYAEEAVSRGAAAVVAERNLPLDVPQIIVENARRALSLAASKFYGEPSKRLKMLGVTGTNGKTTTTYILRSILESAGHKTGIIGTNAVVCGDETVEATMTTPDPIDLHRILRRMADSGAEYVVMEVSAHALALHKVDGIIFEAVAFTNLSRDHLDFFRDMDTYAAAKFQLFTAAHAKFAVVNADDLYGIDLIKSCRLPMLTYGCVNPCDVFAIDLKMSVGGLEYVLNLSDDIAEVKFNLPGRFNMYNTLCAAALARAVDIPLKSIVRGIRNLKKVEGRFNLVSMSRCSVIIDFAHTDDGLANLLNTVREFAEGRIITVFGCGGNRDRTKRPVMGRIVSTLSDFCVITSDNPRFENPMDIIGEIEAGIRSIKKDNYCIIEDRREAIRYAVEMAQKDDIVLVAGKGAEKYQDIMGIKQPYNDEKYIMEIAREFEL